MDQLESDAVDFRGLFESITEYEGLVLYSEVLLPWLGKNGVLASRWLRAFAERPGNPVPEASIEDLFDLYALSRVHDALLANLQVDPNGQARGATAAPLSLIDYTAFVTALGLQMTHATAFCPFFHEIVTVEQDADADASLIVVRELWPTICLGDMLVARAGVVVRGGRNHVKKEIAENSTLYWAYWRRNRPRTDLSVGWGGNSQWGTAFRRDYRIGTRIFVNVDGKNDLRVPPPGDDRDGLTPAERRELLLHRCFITADKPHTDLWPYDDTYQYDAEVANDEPA